MNSDHLAGIPANFDPSSRVWIYQGHRSFTPGEAAQTRGLLDSFTQSWTSHGTPVRGFATISHDQFIILMADETASGVSGCSTDSSVHLIKQIEKQTGVQLFDRLNLAFYIKDKVVLIPLSQIPQALKTGHISSETLHFDNTIQCKEELETRWLIPLNNSWLGTRFASAVAIGVK
jgi:hypothetical protein